MKPKILLLDEPTRGIDVGAKSEIYALMEDLAESGVAILFVSSEMEEILGMADRALVMPRGSYYRRIVTFGTHRGKHNASRYGRGKSGRIKDTRDKNSYER